MLIVRDLAVIADVFDIPVEELVVINPEFKRYIRILKENGINTTVELATSYIKCTLGSCHGLGKKFFGLLKDFLDHHVTYKQMYDEIKNLNIKEDETHGTKKNTVNQ